MEAEIVVGASSLGVLVSILLFIDAVRERWLVLHSEPPRPELHELTRHQMIGEGVRLGVQSMFLTAGVVSVTGAANLRSVVVALLVGIPIILAAWSIYTWIRKRRLLRQVDFDIS
jgi:hypothetical protein